MTLQSFDDGNSDEARQFLLDRKCERKHPKRHRTMNRAKRISAAKKLRAAHKVAINNIAARRFKNEVRAFWSGKRDGHP